MLDRKKVIIIANSSTFHQAPRGIQGNRIIDFLASIYDIFLITSNKSIPDRKRYFDNELKNITVIRQSSDLYFKIQKIVLGFLGSYDMFFMLKSLIKGNRLIKKEQIKLVITHSVKISNAFTGSFLKLKYGNNITVFSFYSDPFSFNDYIPKNRITNKLVLELEKFLFNHQDFIVFPSKVLMERYVKLYPEFQYKFRHIPHCFLSREKRNKNESHKVIIRYIGSLNHLRNPDFLLDSLEQNIEKFYDKFIFEFIGPKSPEMINSFHKRDDKMKSFVHFIGKVKVAEAEKLAISSDILLLIDANIDKSPYLPSKLVDYLKFDIPIIGFSNIDGESFRVLKNSGHYPLDFNDVEKLSILLDNIDVKEYKTKEYLISSVGLKWENLLNQ